MYYISQHPSVGVAQKVKRISDFNGFSDEEGTEWLVRKARDINTHDCIPVYVQRGRKLVRHPAKKVATCWI
jgi:hypothetical protein